jgi:hypothetical protein
MAPLIAPLIALRLLAPAHAAERVLLEEHFDSAATLEGFSQEIGARVGAGPMSVASWQDGALRLDVKPGDQRFLAMGRSLEVEPGTWLKVSVRMRTEGVDPAAARYRNCDVYVIFEGHAVRALPILTGTQPWTPLQAWFQVPAGVSRAELGLFLSMPGSAWFDDLVVTNGDPGFTTLAQGPYVYHWLADDPISDGHRARNEAELERIRGFLDVPAGQPIHYWKYPDRETKQAISSQGGNAHVAGGAIHSVWPVDNHEIVHLLAVAWGDPPALLAEGLAVHLSGGWQHQPVRGYARGLLEADQWIALPALLETRSFRQRDDLITYALAGAFVEWVLLTHGKATLRALYGAPSLHDAAGFEAALREHLGMGAEQADQALRVWVAEG